MKFQEDAGENTGNGKLGTLFAKTCADEHKSKHTREEKNEQFKPQ